MAIHRLQFLLPVLFAICPLLVSAQMAEAYAGNKRAGVDMMWFRFFQNSHKEPTRFLFFSRNRASVDYHNSPALMGSTNALSYQSKKGWGLVFVGSFVNAGFIPKAGIQYFRKNKKWLYFGWLVADLKEKGSVDLFQLLRYQWPESGRWKGMAQVELFPVYQTHTETWNLTERIRLGVQYDRVVAGFMSDLNQTGSSSWTKTYNSGLFIRYEF